MCRRREAPEPPKLGGTLLGGSGAFPHAGLSLMARAYRRRPKAARPGVPPHRRRLQTRGRLLDSWIESLGPNRGRQRRAARSDASPLHAGLGAAEWKRGGLRTAVTADARRRAPGRLRRCADERGRNRRPAVLRSWALRGSGRFRVTCRTLMLSGEGQRAWEPEGRGRWMNREACARRRPPCQ